MIKLIKDNYFLIIFVGLSSVVSEIIYDFSKMKFMYTTFYPEKEWTLGTLNIGELID
jgi:hypothetical protein